MNLSNYKKIIAYIVGVLVLVTTNGLVSGQAATIVNIIILVATGAGIYQAKNTPTA